MRGLYYRVLYEGLQDLCFRCGHYGHRDATCPKKSKREGSNDDEAAKVDGATNSKVTKPMTEDERSYYGEWTLVQRGRRSKLT